MLDQYDKIEVAKTLVSSGFSFTKKKEYNLEKSSVYVDLRNGNGVSLRVMSLDFSIVESYQALEDIVAALQPTGILNGCNQPMYPELLKTTY